MSPPHATTQRLVRAPALFISTPMRPEFTGKRLCRDPQAVFAVVGTCFLFIMFGRNVTAAIQSAVAAKVMLRGGTESRRDLAWIALSVATCSACAFANPSFSSGAYDLVGGVHRVGVVLWTAARVVTAVCYNILFVLMWLGLASYLEKMYARERVSNSGGQKVHTKNPLRVATSPQDVSSGPTSPARRRRHPPLIRPRRSIPGWLARRRNSVP